MPKPGFTSISIKDEHYDHLMQWYKESREIGVLDDSVSSFASFIINKIDESIKEKNSMRTLVAKIECVPAKFTETKLLIKHS